MIKGIIFDLGGVLIDNPAQLMKSYIMSKLEISETDLNAVTSPLMPSFQKGFIDEKEFWRRVLKGTSLKMEVSTSIWTEAIENAYSPKLEMFCLVKTLKRHGLKIGILSNTEIPVFNFLSSKDYSIFDFLVYSCLEGTRKPEKKIYMLAIDRMGFKAEEIIFVDDSEENIRASQENGL
ncbi:MAG: HAD family hydrolase, partial [Candidatus Hodarchaeales archaeon]